MCQAVFSWFAALRRRTRETAEYETSAALTMSWMETVTERGPLAHVCKGNVLHVLRFVKLQRLVLAAMQARDWDNPGRTCTGP